MWPVLLSVPHAGARVPPEVRDRCLLSASQIDADNDLGAREIYALGDDVAGFVTTDVPRAIVDLNRAEDDRRPDGVIKEYTIFQEPVYTGPLSDTLIEELIRKYHRPYHAALSRSWTDVMLGMDCHTMLAEAPPINEDAGTTRPHVCLSNGDGVTCPAPQFEKLAVCLSRAFGFDVALNTPFKGGHIIHRHHQERPWVQLEISRADFASIQEKHECVRRALETYFAEGADPS